MVEAIPIRTVRLRDLSGTVLTIPFSAIDTVSNLTRDFSFYVLDLGVAYREDVDELRSDPEIGLTVDFDTVRLLIGKGGDKLIPEAFGCSSDSEAGKRLGARKREIFMTRFLTQLEPTRGARELLLRLRNEGIRRVLATSSGDSSIQPLLRQAGIEDLIEETTSSSDVGASKPDPEIVEAALKKSGVPASPGDDGWRHPVRQRDGDTRWNSRDRAAHRRMAGFEIARRSGNLRRPGGPPGALRNVSPAIAPTRSSEDNSCIGEQPATKSPSWNVVPLAMLHSPEPRLWPCGSFTARTRAGRASRRDPSGHHSPRR